MIGRRAGAKIEAMADEHIPWLWEFMNRKVAGALAA
jgi:hypothetical protein